MIKSNTGFLPYDRDTLFSKIDTINIYRKGDTVITEYLGRVIKTTNVSIRYEVFDIKTFLKSKIEQLQNNFNITYYKLRMKSGVQELTLLSDEVIINNTPYYKSFFILNSSDKSRKLNINLGLYRSDNNSYLISSIRNVSMSKRHLKGVTETAYDVSQNIDIETFDEQISCIKSLIGERVMLSEIKKILVDTDLNINHRKFDAFKNMLMFSRTDKTLLTPDQRIALITPSTRLVLNDLNDFSIDAYTVFNCYIQIFSNQDSYVVRKETDKILKITQCFIRNEKLDLLLNFI